MISIHTSKIPIINYVIATNKLPLIKWLKFKNKMSKNLTNVRVRIYSEPQFMRCEDIFLDCLLFGEEKKIVNIIPTYNLPFLYDLHNDVKARVTIQVIYDNMIVSKYTEMVHVADFHYYWGNSYNVKCLASYVTPHNITLELIFNRASEILFCYTGSRKMVAYMNNDTNYSITIIRSLYEAIQELHLALAYPVTTLREFGQRLRLCDEILITDRKGCCLDMALLLSSCLEKVGMNPILIIQHNHAFLGCWLTNNMSKKCLHTTLNSIIENTICANPTILLIETTYLIYKLKRSANRMIPFEEAISKANALIMKKEDFSFAIDVRRARLDGIKPLILLEQ